MDSNGNANVNTWIWASYLEPGTFTRPRKVPISGLQDIQALSHELSEWLNDPFGLNAVTPWSTPTAPQYGCSLKLETGDPLVGFWFPISGNPDPSPFAGGVWHPQDSVFPQWFLRQSPSSAFDGHYTFMGTDTTNAGAIFRSSYPPSGRQRGTIFLIDPRKRVVLWSTYELPKNSSPAELDRSATRISNQLRIAFGKK